MEDKLSPESYYILRKEGTERAFSSKLNNEKRKGIFIVQVVVKRFSRPIQNLIVELDGLVFGTNSRFCGNEGGF